MEYEINSETLAIIPLQKGKSKILELNDEYEILEIMYGTTVFNFISNV